MPTTTKILGWGRNSVTITPASGTATTHNDIVEGSTSLSVEEGQETEALIEGGTAEGRRKAVDKYTLTYNRRIGDASDVAVGYTEDVGTVKVEPENTGAIGVTLTGCSRHVAVKFDSTDGLVAVYTYKTKGAIGDDGSLSDVTFQAKAVVGS